MIAPGANGPLKVCGLKFKVSPIGLANIFPPAWGRCEEPAWRRWKLGLKRRAVARLARTTKLQRGQGMEVDARSDRSDCWRSLAGQGGKGVHGR